MVTQGLSAEESAFDRWFEVLEALDLVDAREVEQELEPAAIVD